MHIIYIYSILDNYESVNDNNMSFNAFEFVGRIRHVVDKIVFARIFAGFQLQTNYRIGLTGYLP